MTDLNSVSCNTVGSTILILHFSLLDSDLVNKVIIY